MQKSKTKANELHFGARWGSMMLDHAIMCIPVIMFLSPSFVQSVIRANEIAQAGGDETLPFSNMLGITPLAWLGLIGMSIYLNKDAIQARSPGKRIMKTQILNHATGEPASPVRCVIRNLFFGLWPIEGLAVLASPQRRLGDLIAGTRVDVYDPELEAETNVYSAIVAFVIGAGIALLWVWFTIWLLEAMIGAIPTDVQVDYESV